MTVAEHEGAPALDPQQSYLLITTEASLPIHLLDLRGLQSELFHRLDQIFLGCAQGSGRLGGRLGNTFFLFAAICFSE
jgi:hypothetical protein